VVLWFGFRIFAPDAVSIVRSVRMTGTMLPAMLMIWATVSLSTVASVRKTRCSVKNIVGIVTSPPIVGVDY
jgi:hypothetical protein